MARAGERMMVRTQRRLVDGAARWPHPPAVVWHDVECGGYSADLDLWRALAASHGGQVLEVGCGTGRVSLDLAKRGHQVLGIDMSVQLVEAFRRGAREQNVDARALVQDARSLKLGRCFKLVISPMQVVQLLGGPRGRQRFYQAAARHLQPDGLLVIALANPVEGIPPAEVKPPLPDVREIEGWMFTSRPVDMRLDRGGTKLAIHRLREAVSPSGELDVSRASVVLDVIEPLELIEEARKARLDHASIAHISATAGYAESTIVSFRRASSGPVNGR